MQDGKSGKLAADLPSLSGNGSVSIGLVLYGTNGDYTTDDIANVAIVE